MAYEGKDINEMMASALPGSVARAIDALESGGYEAYVVGGCVRDTLLGKVPHDWDLTTSATPEQMKEAMPFRHFDTGLQHGTVTFLVDGEPIETTVYRTEGAYSDGRHPDSVAFTTSLEEDLARRDFTVNAMAWSPTRGLADPFDGVSDLDDNLLRCVRDPHERFNEDGLRVMRALRFASVYGFEVEENTAAAVHDCKGMLSPVSAERIQVETVKMMSAPDGKHLANIMDEFHDVVFEAMPELEPMYGFDQENKHHDEDLWHHSLSAMANIEPEASGSKADPMLRFAALVHDVGKIETQTFDSNGQAHYYGHMAAGASIVEDMMRRMKFSNEELDDVCFLVAQHDNRPAPRDRSARRFLVKCGDGQTASRLLSLMRADASVHDPETASKVLADLDGFQEVMDRQMAQDAVFSMKDMDFSGKDLIAMGWEPGPAMGAELKRVFADVVDGKLENDRDAIADEVERHASLVSMGLDLPEEDMVWVSGHWRGKTKVKGYWRRR